MTHSRDLCTCDGHGTCAVCRVNDHLASMGLKEGSDEGDVFPAKPEPSGDFVCEYAPRERVEVPDGTDIYLGGIRLMRPGDFRTKLEGVANADCDWPDRDLFPTFADDMPPLETDTTITIVDHYDTGEPVPTKYGTIRPTWSRQQWYGWTGESWVDLGPDPTPTKDMRRMRCR